MSDDELDNPALLHREQNVESRAGGDSLESTSRERLPAMSRGAAPALPRDGPRQASLMTHADDPAGNRAVWGCGLSTTAGSYNAHIRQRVRT